MHTKKGSLLRRSLEVSTLFNGLFLFLNVVVCLPQSVGFLSDPPSADV